MGKEWDPESWDGDIWADSDEAEYPEPLNSPKPPLQLGAALHSV